MPDVVNIIIDESPIAVQVPVSTAITLDMGTVIRPMYQKQDHYTAVAAEPIGGHRVVRIDTDGLIRHADHREIAHAGHVAGVALQAIEAGRQGDIKAMGDMACPLSLDLAAICFLGETGMIIQQPPTTGFRQPVGMMAGVNRLWVKIGEPTIL